MSEKTVAQKLFIKEGMKVIFVNTPQGYQARLRLPKKVTVLKQPTEPADFIQVFVADRKELEEQLPRLKKMLSPKGMLWVCYHKGTSKTKTDIHRDTINAYAHTIGLEGVSLISVDDDWSAMRFKVS